MLFLLFYSFQIYLLFIFLWHLCISPFSLQQTHKPLHKFAHFHICSSSHINKVFCKNRNFSPFTKLTNEKRKKFYILQKTLNIQKFFRLNNVSGCQSFSFISDPLDLYQYIYRLYHKYLFLYFYVFNIFSVFLCFIK